MLRWKYITSVLLAFALLLSVGMPSVWAAQSGAAPEDAIVFSDTDDALCVLLRPDEAVRGVSEHLAATLVPKSALQPVQQIEGSLIRVLLPQEENGGRLEICVPVPVFDNGMTLRVQGLTDSAGAETERTWTFDRTNYLTDRIEIEYPDPDVTEQFRQYAQDVEARRTIYCLVGDELRVSVYSPSLQDRVQVHASGVTLTPNADGSFTAGEAGEGKLIVTVAGNVQKTMTLCVLRSAQARKQLLMQTMADNAASIMGKHFHRVVALGVPLAPFSVLLVPILYPLACVAAPIGLAAELLQVLFS